MVDYDEYSMKVKLWHSYTGLMKKIMPRVNRRIMKNVGKIGFNIPDS